MGKCTDKCKFPYCEGADCGWEGAYEDCPKYIEANKEDTEDKDYYYTKPGDKRVYTYSEEGTEEKKEPCLIWEAGLTEQQADGFCSEHIARYNTCDGCKYQRPKKKEGTEDADKGVVIFKKELFPQYDTLPPHDDIFAGEGKRNPIGVLRYNIEILRDIDKSGAYRYIEMATNYLEKYYIDKREQRREFKQKKYFLIGEFISRLEQIGDEDDLYKTKQYYQEKLEKYSEEKEK